MIVPDLLSRRAAHEPERTALVVEGAGSLTFAEWQRRSDAIARALARRGVKPGERVGLLFAAEEWIDFAVAFCAVQIAGAVAVPLSDRLAPVETGRVLADCSASALLHGLGVRPPESACWKAVLAELSDDGGAPLDVVVRPHDPAQILYTSGTTGTPKGVVATHANLTYGHAPKPSRRRFAHSSHLLHAFPIGTNAGQMMLINALDARPAVLTHGRFTPGRFARLIESYRVGTLFLVPSMAIELLNAGLHERHDFSSVLLLGSVAAALPPALSARLVAAFPNAAIANYYTSTEAAPAQTVMMYDPERPGALGRPAFGSALRVTDAAGSPLPAGETGEIWLRSPAAARSYYGDPDAEAFNGRWVRMGDVGYLDADGYLHLVDRESDVVKSGAFKVSTVRVEAALYEHPGVAEAAVVGVDHPVLGTALQAAVIPRQAQQPPTPGEIRGFLTERLALHELPERVFLVDALPRNQLGKVVKAELRELLEGLKESVR